MFETRKWIVFALSAVGLLSVAACSEAPVFEQSPGDVSSAIEDGDAELLEHLLEDGVDINRVQSVSGYTPLHQAADVGNVEAIELLLAKGAPTEKISTAGVTPLLLALANGHEDAAIALISGGANVAQSDGNGMTPLAYARTFGLTRAAYEIQARGGR